MLNKEHVLNNGATRCEEMASGISQAQEYDLSSVV